MPPCPAYAVALWLSCPAWWSRHVINDQDVVARGAKFWVLYKRGGHRVLINSLGDLIVRPTAMETSLRLVPCSGSVQQHLLTSYLKSLLAVLLTQFSRKRIKGGMTGVVELAKQNTAIKARGHRCCSDSIPHRPALLTLWLQPECCVGACSEAGAWALCGSLHDGVPATRKPAVRAGS